MATLQTDNRYGKVRYGGTKYGASQPGDNLVYALEVAWAGEFTGENEAPRMTGFTVERGRAKFIGTNGINFEPVGIGKMSVVLDNSDGRYDGWNTSSPLYPNVTFGKEIKLRVRDMNTGAAYPLFHGWITNITISGYGAMATATIDAEDGAQWMTGRSSRVGLSESISPEAAIAAILAKIGWKWGSSLDTTSDVLRYWWSDSDKSALTNLEEIAQSVGGYFYFSADGKAIFRSRASLAGSGILNQDELLKDVIVPQPWEYGFEAVRIIVHPIAKSNITTIYQLQGSTPQIAAGGKIILWGSYSYNGIRCAAVNVISPVAGTDWTVNSAADGSGTDLTAQCTLSIYDFGDVAKMTIKNNSGTTGYLTLLQIRGQAIYTTSVEVAKPDDNEGMVELKLDYPWMQDVNKAIDFANIYQPFFAARHPFPVVAYEARPDKQFGFELFDVVTLNLPKYGLNGVSYRVGRISHKNLTENCQAVRTEITLEPYYGSTGNYWTWPITNFGVDTIFGW